MMRKREGGQAFILVLILLTIGVLLVIPAMQLTNTTLKSSQIVTRQARALYAADAAQEYVLWKLRWDNWGSQFTTENPEGYAYLDCCGVSVNITVILRAVVGRGAITLAGDDVIQPAKTVSPNATDWNDRTYTYTINLEQLSDNTSQGLDAIYDIPPEDFGAGAYVDNSSQLSLDGGATWLDIPDPEWNAAKGYLKWPADYEWDPVVTGAFSSDNESDPDHYFYGIRDFTPRQVKRLRFQMNGRLRDNTVHCNWVVLKPWNTVSGPQAPITVGNPADPGGCEGSQVLEVSKSSDPDIIQPGVETDITYTISISNLYNPERKIESIIDFLPPEFEYIGPTTGAVTLEPQVTLENVNGVERYKLLWTTPEFGGGDLSIASGETLIITFEAKATKDVSGSYYNEVFAILRTTGIASAFLEAGVEPSDYASNYSWNTGAVTVPTYDSRADAEGLVLDANMALLLESVSITSYQVR